MTFFQKTSILFILLLLHTTYVRTAFAQKVNLDSIFLEIKKGNPEDTVYIINTITVANEYLKLKPDSALLIADEIKINSQKINFLKGIVVSERIKGTYYSMHKNQYEKAEEILLAALESASTLPQKDEFANILNLLGVVFKQQAKYDKALLYYFEGLKTFEAAGNIQGISLIYSNIGIIFKLQENYEKSEEYYLKALKIKEELDDQRGIGIINNNIGNMLLEQREFARSIPYFEKARDVFDALKDHRYKSICYVNLADAFMGLGALDKALPLLENGLSLATESQFIPGLTASKLRLSRYYNLTADPKKALSYANEAQELAVKMQHIEFAKDGAEEAYKAAKTLNLKDLALESYEKYITLRDSISSEHTKNNLLGKEWQFKEEKSKIEQEKKDLEYEANLKNQKTIQYSLLAGFVLMVGIAFLAFISYRTKRKSNLDLLNKNIEIQNINQALEHQKEEIEAQAENLKVINNEIRLAYDNIHVLSEIGRSVTASLDLQDMIRTLYAHVNKLMPAEFFGIGVYNIEKARIEFTGFIEFGEEIPFNYDALTDKTKLSVQCLESNKEIIIKDLQVEFESLFGVSLETDVITGARPSSLIYLPLKVEDRVVGVITVQSTQNHAYKETDVEILRTLGSYTSIAIENSSAYKIIESKNEHITDSIRYARQIQQAVLSTKEEFLEYFDEVAVVFHPKDIVSGDFFWLSVTDSHIFIAVADCTGHGVPGAFMSMIGTSFLDEAVNEKRYTSPAEILSWMNKQLIYALKQDQHVNTDGMDLVLLAIQKNVNEDENTQIVYSSARRPLFYVQNQEVLEGSADRKSIGGLRNLNAEFTDVTLSLPKSSMIYLFSDGITDQNKAEGQKWGRLGLKDWISLHKDEHLQTQEQTLNEWVNTMTSNNFQRDDITLLAIRI